VNGFEAEETCMGLNDFWEHRVIITPTSSGFRKLLKKKEIPFILPVSARRLSNGVSDSCQSLQDSNYYSNSYDISNSVPARRENTPPPIDKENILPFLQQYADGFGEDVSPVKLGEDIEQDEWLRTIGYSPAKIKISIMDSQDPLNAEDTVNSVTASVAGTTISITQMDAIDKFCTLMLDLNLGWAKTGHQAGLPPTLLATESFLNSALKSLNFHTQVLKKPSGTLYTLDVDDGPILPHVPRLMHEFLQACNNQLEKNNTMKFHVNGRSACNGLNEATSVAYKNLNEVTFDGSKLRYFY